MGLPQENPAYILPETYLAAEMQSDTRSEYLKGEVFAMVGTSSAHNVIVGNLYMALRNHLRGGLCQVFALDLKLRVEAANAYFYPELMVTCSEADRNSDFIKSEAVLVVEVLSPSTALFDRDKKFASYRLLPSLQEYVLVDTEQEGVEYYRRSDNGEWIMHPYGAGETVTLHGLNLTFPIGTVYQDVVFTPNE
ncbi:MAG: Uma2 family endonuclease [Gammaproteobacteria bacterium]|nr:Uma2 family endonuclease [Gammaproteobacteria bacterium]MBU1732869.1 Uma2 family endonuclease [Gammaproteobacteria bacterium]MBU1893173.1 Uma2 family endonuclease [Gammaproteobacteria bacterium]